MTNLLNETKEAKFANSLDKMEAEMQHSLHIDQWNQGDYDVTPYYKDHLFNFDSFIRSFKDMVNDQLMEKIVSAKMGHKVNKKYLEKYKQKKLL